MVIALDISGSMGANFNRYYYDTSRRRALDGERKSKIEIATESIVAMLSHLNGDDRFGVVLLMIGHIEQNPLES